MVTVTAGFEFNKDLLLSTGLPCGSKAKLAEPTVADLGQAIPLLHCG